MHRVAICPKGLPEAASHAQDAQGCILTTTPGQRADVVDYIDYHVHNYCTHLLRTITLSVESVLECGIIHRAPHVLNYDQI